jgi:hypothetical protein
MNKYSVSVLRKKKKKRSCKGYQTAAKTPAGKLVIKTESYSVMYVSFKGCSNFCSFIIPITWFFCWSRYNERGPCFINKDGINLVNYTVIEIPQDELLNSLYFPKIVSFGEKKTHSAREEMIPTKLH